MTTLVDPVCGMAVDEEQAAGKSGYKGNMYYFCSSDCKSKFDSHPSEYIKDEGQSANNTQYT